MAQLLFVISAIFIASYSASADQSHLPRLMAAHIHQEYYTTTTTHMPPKSAIEYADIVTEANLRTFEKLLKEAKDNPEKFEEVLLEESAATLFKMINDSFGQTEIQNANSYLEELLSQPRIHSLLHREQQEMLTQLVRDSLRWSFEIEEDIRKMQRTKGLGDPRTKALISLFNKDKERIDPFARSVGQTSNWGIKFHDFIHKIEKAPPTKGTWEKIHKHIAPGMMFMDANSLSTGAATLGTTTSDFVKNYLKATDNLKKKKRVTSPKKMPSPDKKEKKTKTRDPAEELAARVSEMEKSVVSTLARMVDVKKDSKGKVVVTKRKTADALRAEADFIDKWGHNLLELAGRWQRVPIPDHLNPWRDKDGLPIGVSSLGWLMLQAVGERNADGSISLDVEEQPRKFSGGGTGGGGRVFGPKVEQFTGLKGKAPFAAKKKTALSSKSKKKSSRREPASKKSSSRDPASKKKHKAKEKSPIAKKVSAKGDTKKDSAFGKRKRKRITLRDPSQLSKFAQTDPDDPIGGARGRGFRISRSTPPGGIVGPKTRGPRKTRIPTSKIPKGTQGSDGIDASPPDFSSVSPKIKGLSPTKSIRSNDEAASNGTQFGGLGKSKAEPRGGNGGLNSNFRDFNLNTSNNFRTAQLSGIKPSLYGGKSRIKRRSPRQGRRKPIRIRKKSSLPRIQKVSSTVPVGGNGQIGASTPNSGGVPAKVQPFTKSTAKTTFSDDFPTVGTTTSTTKDLTPTLPGGGSSRRVGFDRLPSVKTTSPAPKSAKVQIIRTEKRNPQTGMVTSNNEKYVATDPMTGNVVESEIERDSKQRKIRTSASTVKNDGEYKIVKKTEERIFDPNTHQIRVKRKITEVQFKDPLTGKISKIERTTLELDSDDVELKRVFLIINYDQEGREINRTSTETVLGQNREIPNIHTAQN